ncbi:uncharacterized protein [Acropora muricata]
MYMVNSYLHVLKNIDSSWGDSTNSTGFKKSSRRWRSRKRTRSSPRSRNDSHDFTSTTSSSESGLFSEEWVNSGYFGDDEVDRCHCQSCLEKAETNKPKSDFAADYDIISSDLSPCETPKQESIVYHLKTRENYHDYIIVASSKEEFVYGNQAHSTPFDITKIPELDISALLPDIPPVRVDIQNKLCCSHVELNGNLGLSSPSPPVLHRATNVQEVERFWWRDNVLWQLQQRNKTQTKRFSQLLSHEQRCRAKVQINRELADYLNKCGQLRAQNETSNSTSVIDLDVEPIERSELVLAIRNHGISNERTQEAEENPVASNSIANLASTYLNRQRALTEEKLTESDDSSGSPPCATSRMSPRATKVSPSKKWRANLVNQLQMRNFLECKFFTDGLARRAMTQMNISEKESVPKQGLAEYDIITDDEVSGLSTVMNSTNSTSLSQGYVSSAPLRRRFFKRGKRR